MLKFLIHTAIIIVILIYYIVPFVISKSEDINAIVINNDTIHVNTIVNKIKNTVNISIISDSVKSITDTVVDSDSENIESDYIDDSNVKYVY